MKILAFTNLFPSVDEPTRGIFNLHRFSALAKYSPVHVVVPVPAWKRIGRPGDLMTTPSKSFDGVSATYPTWWSVPRIRPQWHAQMMYRSVKPHVERVAKSSRFDVVLGAFAYPDTVVAARLARDAGLPLVALVMGSDINELATREALRQPIRSALQQADAVIALSSALKSRVVELGIAESKIVVQRNGVDGTRFVVKDKKEARQTLNLPPSGRIACFIGNLVHEKGPDVLVEAVARLNPDVRESLLVVFVGDGSLRSQLQDAAASLGIGSNVRFVGRKASDEIPVWMAASDLLCLPSRREGCPNVVLEALAAGRPVVASNVGGVPELLSERNGVLVAAEDPLALAQGISLALNRGWDAAQLRGSVSSLGWDESGKTFFRVLSSVYDSRAARITA